MARLALLTASLHPTIYAPSPHVLKLRAYGPLREENESHSRMCLRKLFTSIDPVTIDVDGCAEICNNGRCIGQPHTATPDCALTVDVGLECDPADFAAQVANVVLFVEFTRHRVRVVAEQA